MLHNRCGAKCLEGRYQDLDRTVLIASPMKKQTKAKRTHLLLSVDKVRELSTQESEHVAGGACNGSTNFSVCTRSNKPLF